MDLYDIFNINKTQMDINNISPLVWAYIGDCVYELYIRNNLVNTTNLKPHKLHIETIKYVKAVAQANFLHNIMDKLTEKEKDIVRRTRNTRKSSYSKKCNS